MLEFPTIAFLSLVFFAIVARLSKKFHTEKQIMYLVFGILIGLLVSLTSYKDLDNMFPSISSYNLTALMFMFFTAGFTADFKQIKRSGKLTLRMTTIPAYFETFVMSLCVFGAITLFPDLGFKLSILDAIIVSAVFSTASPANTIPICSTMIQQGYTGKNNIPTTMVLSSIIDGFIVFPVVFIALFLKLLHRPGINFSYGLMFGLMIGIVVCLALSIVLGIVIGRFIIFVAHSAFVRLNDKKQPFYKNVLVILIAFFLSVLIAKLLQNINILNQAISLFGILIMWGIGLGINYFDKTRVNKIIKRDGNKLFALFGTPVIFIYVGASINLASIINLRYLLFFMSLTLIAITAKGFGTKFVLKDKKFTNGERTFAKLCFFPKGMGLINFTVILSTIFNPNGNLISFMTLYGTIGIILSFSIGLPRIAKAKGTLIPKAEPEETIIEEPVFDDRLILAK